MSHSRAYFNDNYLHHSGYGIGLGDGEMEQNAGSDRRGDGDGAMPGLWEYAQGTGFGDWLAALMGDAVAHANKYHYCHYHHHDFGLRLLTLP